MCDVNRLLQLVLMMMMPITLLIPSYTVSFIHSRFRRPRHITSVSFVYVPSYSPCDLNSHVAYELFCTCTKMNIKCILNGYH